MKYLLNTCNTFLVLVVIICALGSCSASRRSEGFQYRATVKTPDIASGNQALNRDNDEFGTNTENYKNDNSSGEFQELISLGDKGTTKLPNSDKEKINRITEALMHEYRAQLENGVPMTNRELVKKVTENLVSNGSIDQLSKPGMKKLDRLAKNMDKKLQKQGKDIDVKNNTNLELFFMIMGIAGLVLGILGVWVGWLLFVVFGGLYLYYKLVK